MNSVIDIRCVNVDVDVYTLLYWKGAGERSEGIAVKRVPVMHVKCMLANVS